MSLANATSLTAAMQAACRTYPESPAVTFERQSICYRELDERADRIAAGLQRRGVRRGDLVGLFCERSIDLIAAMLGIWRAGAAYLPIDPGYPAARVQQILQGTPPALLIVDAATQAAARDVVTATAPLQELLHEQGTPEPVASSREDLAYVIFTSGSTGAPKGVAVTHGNVLHMLAQTEPWFRFNELDVWTMFHSSAFDFSVFEIWGCLLYGGRLVVVPFQTSRLPGEFRELLRRERVTVLCQTPSAFQMLVAAEQGQSDRLDALRVVVFGGEALNFRSLLPWFDRYSDTAPQLVNMYGITEITVHATYRVVTRSDAERETESLIGVPIPGSQIYLVNDKLQPADEGEMLIAGPGVAVGYLGRPELTAERFPANPFGEGRVYRSGDLARRRADGELVYLGRADRQVKVQGFRIEPGEVEAALLQRPEVRQAFVCAVSHPVAGASLAAYVVADASRFDAAQLAAFAAGVLPPQMRPAHYLRTDALPLTVNGKIDRDALPSPFATEAVAPQTERDTIHLSVGQKVALAWQSVLQTRADIDPEMNFFEAGGNSLLLIALQAELARLLVRPVPAVWLFQFPTVATLTQKLLSQEAVRSDIKESSPAVTRGAKASPFRPFLHRKELTQ